MNHGCTLMLILTALAAPAMAAEDFGGAAWLRDPVFDGVPVIDLLHRQGAKGPELTGPQNVHTLFRKEVSLKAAPTRALLTITGDDYYHFSINGFDVVLGPEGGYDFNYPCYWLDVTEFLVPGANCLASHVYYQGLVNRAFNSGDNRSGFMLRLEVTYGDGNAEVFQTDGSWKCLTLDAFSGEPSIGYKTQFVENIDMRKMPVGWRVAGFDDGAWAAPLTGRQDHVFNRQITPPIQRYRLDPAVVKDLGGGRFFYDFGKELVGCTRITVTGPEGHVITVRHGEELSGPDEVRYKLRANCTYEEKVTLSGGEDRVAFYDYKAFRYAEVLDAPGPLEFWVEVRHHPFDEGKAVIASSMKLVEDIWRICKNGVQMGSQGGFLDCPSREKGQYLGDTVIIARSHLWLSGDTSLTKKAIRDYADSARIHPGLMAVAPGNFMQEICEYSLQYVFLLEHYLDHSGDAAFVREIMDEVFPGLYGYFAGFEDEHGLVTGMKGEKWVLVDWPGNLRDGYDYAYAENRANTVVNAFYYGSLKAVARLSGRLGLDPAPWEAKAERVAEAFATQLADPATGLYVDAPGSAHSSLHANAIPLAFGLTRGADRDAMVNLIREKRLSCGVYIASYVIEGLFRAGEGDLAWDLITSDDEHSWQEMLKHGATACLEAWGPDQKGNCSWCHPWSSCPVYLIAEYVLGITPAGPGWDRIRVAPVRIDGLPELNLTLPHPDGHITARYREGLGYEVTVPRGVAVEVEAPEGVPVTVRHALSHRAPGADAAEELAAAGWDARVGDGKGIWVSIDRQELCLVEGGRPVWQAPCATGFGGSSSLVNSNGTPLGWHRVAQKIGHGAPWGQVFRARKPEEVWKPGDEAASDLVLTRILVLDGEEPGLNQGVNADGVCVDSRQRYIYVHGTNAEERIGTPASHGCVRLLNDDVITLFDRVEEGTPLLITERGAAHS